MKTHKHQLSTRNICDMCCKDMGERSTRYCVECMKAIQKRAEPRDCTYCGGKQTVHATYQTEGDYDRPYICHKCMRDASDGCVWDHIPTSIMDMCGTAETDEQVRIINW